MNVEEEIDELKKLVEKNIEVTEETNRIVHKMRRSALWGRFFQLAWWFAIIAVSGATYYLYLQPYVGQLTDMYVQLREGSQQAHSFSAQIQDVLLRYKGQ